MVDDQKVLLKISDYYQPETRPESNPGNDPGRVYSGDLLWGFYSEDLQWEFRAVYLKYFSILIKINRKYKGPIKWGSKALYIL